MRHHDRRPWFAAPALLARADVTPRALLRDAEYDIVLRCTEQAAAIRHVIDVNLVDSVFSLLEGMLPEYAMDGRIRQPAGAALPGGRPRRVGWAWAAALVLLPQAAYAQKKKPPPKPPAVAPAVPRSISSELDIDALLAKANALLEVR